MCIGMIALPKYRKSHKLNISSNPAMRNIHESKGLFFSVPEICGYSYSGEKQQLGIQITAPPARHPIQICTGK